MFAYEATLHVPLIVATFTQDAERLEGLVIDAPVRHIDIVPTVLDAIGADRDTALPAGVAAAGHRRRRRGGPAVVLRVDDLQPGARLGAAARRARRRATSTSTCRCPSSTIWRPIRSEQANLVGAQRDRVQVLVNLLRGYNTAPPNRPGQETAEATAALRSLGYVSGSAPAKAIYTEADDPKRLVQIDNDLHTATELIKNGRRDEAIAMLQSVIARRPDTADAYLSLAYAYWDRRPAAARDRRARAGR